MKKNILFILSLIFLLPSCADMLDQYSHTAIPPDAVVESDLAAVRAGMYNRVQEAPGTLTYVIFDFVGGDINQKEYTPIQLIDAQLKSGSTMSGEWNGSIQHCIRLTIQCTLPTVFQVLHSARQLLVRHTISVLISI